ncbi:MAG: cytidine deaminase [Chlorobi bacterium]|nr:cytidine deaminase [Chlorobiota bacterium]
MQEIKISVTVFEYNDISDLPEQERHLMELAVKATDFAYAPYSTFRVGTALLLENGEIITGNNQENMAYPSGLCAERVALFYAASQYPDVAVNTVAITARANDFEIDHPVAPCGACRQVMAETENRSKNKMKLIMMGEKGKVQVVEGVDNILPLMFHEENLKKKK